MGNFYRVSVENEDGATVLELMAPAEMLRQFAPSAVAAALGATIKDDVPGGVYGEPVRHEQAGQSKQRRPRRTKAEMEAARAAEIEKAAIAEPHNAMVTERDNNGEPVAPTDEHPAGGGRGPEPEKYNPFG